MKVDASQFEIVSIDGELALIVRLGRKLRDGISEVEPLRRMQRVQAAGDPLRLFLPAATEITIGARVRATALYSAYRAWAIAAGLTPVSNRVFLAAMQARGFEKLHSNGHYWLDLQLRAGAPSA